MLSIVQSWLRPATLGQLVINLPPTCSLSNMYALFSKGFGKKATGTSCTRNAALAKRGDAQAWWRMLCEPLGRRCTPQTTSR